MKQSIHMWIALDYDVAALSSVAPTRAAARDEFLTPEGNATVPPVARFDQDFDLVNEHYR